MKAPNVLVAWAEVDVDLGPESGVGVTHTTLIFFIGPVGEVYGGIGEGGGQDDSGDLWFGLQLRRQWEGEEKSPNWFGLRWRGGDGGFPRAPEG